MLNNSIKLIWKVINEIMEVKDVLQNENEIRRANKIGANEDILHISGEDDGYDLRKAEQLGSGKKQGNDNNGND
jgi:hypothetical protein